MERYDLDRDRLRARRREGRGAGRLLRQARGARSSASPHPGGAGINTGTVPSKTLRETALYFSGLRQRGLYGVDYQRQVRPRPCSDFMYREQESCGAARGRASQPTSSATRSTSSTGAARFDDPHTVRVRRRRQPTACCTATSSSSPPAPCPPGPGTSRSTTRASTTATTILAHGAACRARMAVVGAGVIGCEYASIFAALGIEVTPHRRPRPAARLPRRRDRRPPPAADGAASACDLRLQGRASSALRPEPAACGSS